MLEQLTGIFVSFFANPSAWGIGLAIVFGAIWVAAYWPPLFKRPWLWAILVGGAILTSLATAYIQVPLQSLTNLVLELFWNEGTLSQLLLLLSVIPIALISGLVQEGSKLVPVVLYWWRKGKNIDPKLGLTIGAVAGVGYGIFEAQWILNDAFASGWSWGSVQTNGLLALAEFWDRFFAVAFHTASCALAGYGLAKGKGWQFYLIVSSLHFGIIYIALFRQASIITVYQVEGFIAAWAILVSTAALWLRWRTEPATQRDKKGMRKPRR